MPWSDVVCPDDDRLHNDAGDPLWNESGFTTFQVPERDLLGVIYYQLRPGLGIAVGGLWLSDPSGEDIYSCRHWAYESYMPLPKDADMFDVALPNGLTVTTGELFRSYHFAYEHPRCQLDLTFTATMDPYYMRLDDGVMAHAVRDWLQTVPEDVSVGHYEHAGWMKGTVVLDGETIEVESPSLRDRTWGPRLVLSNRSGSRAGYPFAMASDDSSFQFFAMSDLPHDTDPIGGTTERVSSGWYRKDGITGDLVSGTRRCVERGPDGRPLREIIEATDHLGRTLEAEGEIRTVFRWTGHSHCMSQWCLATWNYDGHEVRGEMQDYLFFSQYRRLLATQRQLAASA